ncbi:MAG: TetR family transcriptional regulator [Pseudonocardiaceae bacterium]|nr:TetR family transcriptional regulator [Pseudonocardiaceae bacterium]
MPPAFSGVEKTRIRKVLLDAGHRLFTTQGLRKTSLEDIVAPAGIAKSSFYLFFDSKEALYLELMMARMSAVKKKVIDGALLAEPSTREGLRRFLHASIDELATDPLYGRLMTHPDELEAVARKLDLSRLTAEPDNPATALTTFIGQRQSSGDLIPAEPAVITGVLQAVLLLPMHAARLSDPRRYPEILDLLIDIVAAGLTRREGTN